MADSLVHLKLLIPSDVIGCIIGKGGEQMKRIREISGAQISWSRDSYPGSNDRPCLLKGDHEQVEKAHHMIMDQIDDRAQDPTQRKIKILVPDTTAGRIIGKGAQKLKEVMRESSAKVHVWGRSEDPDLAMWHERTVTIEGKRDNATKAMELVYKQIVDDPKSRSCPELRYTSGNDDDRMRSSSSDGGGGDFPWNKNSNRDGLFGARPGLLGEGGASDRRSFAGMSESFSGGNFGSGRNFGPQGDFDGRSRGGGFNDMGRSHNMGLGTNMGSGSSMSSGLDMGRNLMGGDIRSSFNSQGGSAGIENLQALLRGSGYNNQSAQDISKAIAVLVDNGIAGTNIRNKKLSVDKLVLFYLLNQTLDEGGDRFGDTNNQRFDGGREDSTYNDRTQFDLEIDDRRIGAVLGPGGRNLTEIMEMTGANVVVSREGIYVPGTKNRIVTIEGPSNAALRAEKIIKQRLDQDRRYNP